MFIIGFFGLTQNPKSGLFCAFAEHIYLLFLKGFPVALHNGVADLFHKLIIEIKVMNNAKTHTQKLASLEQMADIRAGIGLANGAIAIFVDGTGVKLIFEIIKVHQALTCEKVAVAGVAGRHYAIEEVDASVNRLQNIHGGSDAHEIAGFILRHKGFADLDNSIHFLGAFANSQTAQSIAGQIKPAYFLHMADAYIVIYTALTDTEKHLVFIYGFGERIESVHLCLTAIEPTGGAVHRIADISMIGNRRGTFVKRHGDGGCKLGLDLHTHLGAHKYLGAVHVGLEGDPILGDISQLGQGKDLKSAAVGENRLVPIEKFMDAAKLINNILAGANVEVIGVGKLHLTADMLQVASGDPALYGGAGAHVHENRGLYIAVYGFKGAGTRSTAGFMYCKAHFQLPVKILFYFTFGKFFNKRSAVGAITKRGVIGKHSHHVFIVLGTVFYTRFKRRLTSDGI